MASSEFIYRGIHAGVEGYHLRRYHREPNKRTTPIVHERKDLNDDAQRREICIPCQNSDDIYEILCQVACECLADRDGCSTYQLCVTIKLRKQDHYRGRHPKSHNIDGPRPEVSYLKNDQGVYEQVLSRDNKAKGVNVPSSAPVVKGAPRPDVSWWRDGKLWKIVEMKFPTKDGSVDRKTDMQAKGFYVDIVKDHNLDPDDDLINLNVKDDCKCTNSEGVC